MKKTLNRALSLLLVIVMLLSVVPMAMATGEEQAPVEPNGISLSDSFLTLTVGGTATLTATLAPEGATGEIDWNSSNDNIVSVSGGVLTAVAAGNATISAVCGTLTATCAVTVVPEVTGITITGAADGASLEVGKTLALSYTLAPEGAAGTVSWTSSNNDIATVGSDGVVTAKEPGDVTITAECDGHSDSVTLTVVAAAVYTVEITPGSVELMLGDAANSSATLTAVVKDSSGQRVPGAQVTWSMQENSAITLDNGKVTAKAVSTSAVEVYANYTKDGKTYTGTATVSVKENVLSITCSNVSTYDSSVTLSPKYSLAEGVKLKAGTGVSYTYKVGSKDVGSEVTRSECGDYGEHAVVITATAVLDDDRTVTASTTVYVAFAAAANYDIVLKGGISSFDFEDENIFSSVKEDDVAMSVLASMSIYDLIVRNTDPDDAKQVTFIGGNNSAAVAELTGKVGVYEYENYIPEASVTGLENVVLTFKTSSSGTFVFTYEVVSINRLVLTSGIIEITGNGQGEINYSTTYDKAVTFKYNDFNDYWKDSDAVTGNLSYVMFDVSQTSSPYVPDDGKLYTTSTASKQTTANLVKDTMKFKSSATGSYYDLDEVTYVPSTGRNAYSVEIPFVAYGATGSQTLAGTVVIDLNTSGTTITSRGQIFGTNISGLIASDYKDETNATLSYVVFELPEVEDGRLLYSSDASYVREMTRVDEKTNYYHAVDGNDAGTTTDKEISDLEKAGKAVLNRVFFVPAAGKTGKVTIEYTAYDVNGQNPYKGKLVLDITKKTASAVFGDVTANSYSWASDSVDFLYYEGITNGDEKGNYNPKNSITRGDFMLMLYRAFLAEEYDDYNVRSNFTDVIEGTTTYSKETYHAVGVAKALGIAQGDGISYRPKDSISREEAMTLIHRTLETMDLELEYDSGKIASTFSDYKNVSKYAQEPITELIARGIVAGDDKGKLNPKANITRAEMAVILHRVLTY